MRQEDVIAILRASPVPMTASDIVDAHGVRADHVWSDLSSTRDCLYSLERYGFIRRVGTRPCHDRRGRSPTLWEAVA